MWCKAEGSRLGGWTQDSCPAHMLCISHHFEHKQFDFCTCRYSAILAQDSADGSSCDYTIGTLFVIVLWLLLSFVLLLMSCWMFYVLNIARKNRILKFDALGAALIVVTFTCVTNSIDRGLRGYKFLNPNEEIGDLLESLTGATLTAVGVGTLISLAFSGRIMFLTLMQQTKVEFDEGVERRRNARLVTFLIVFGLGLLPLRTLQLNTIGSVYSGCLAFACWRTFRRVGQKAYESWATQISLPAARYRSDALVKDIRIFTMFIMRTIYVFTLGCAVQLLAQGKQNRILNEYVLTACSVVTIIALFVSHAALLFILSSITFYRLEVKTQLKVIAIMVHCSNIGANHQQFSEPELIPASSPLTTSSEKEQDDANLSTMYVI
jgi:hypothetical protein